MEIKNFYQAVAQCQADGTTRIIFSEIVDGETVDLHTFSDSPSLADAFISLGYDIRDGNVFPDPLDAVNLIDGMIVKRGSSRYVRITEDTQPTWKWVNGLGAHPDSQIAEWIMDGSAEIKYDPTDD